MKVFHVSDTHLGYGNYTRLDPERGINQREADFYDSFGDFVELCLNESPDLVLHTGDLFDSVRPSNRAISFALEQIKRISEAGIEFIGISGNHETPRLRETGSVFRILNGLADCHLIYASTSERIVIGDLEIFCIPHTTEEQFRKGLDTISETKTEKRRIIMMHAGVLGLGVFRTNEVNELILNISEIDWEADYVALGHYHNFVEITGNCCYSGSTERLSISEAAHEKGFIEIDLDTARRNFRKLKTRPMIDFEPIDVHGMNAEEVKREMVIRLESRELDGAIVRMNVTGISGDARKNLDILNLRRTAKEALNLELRLMGEEEERLIQGTTAHIGGLEEEFREYLSNISVERLEKGRLERMAMELFAEREE